MLQAISFYVFSALIICCFMIVVTTKQIVYSMSALAAGTILIAGLFFALNADFLGVVQIVVYTGGVMALYAFGLMFFDSSKEAKEDYRRPRLTKFLAIASTVLISLIVAMPILATNLKPDLVAPIGMSNPQTIGALLFTNYLLAFELASIMLLVAMICGIILASKWMDGNGETYVDHSVDLKTFDKEIVEEHK